MNDREMRERYWRDRVQKSFQKLTSAFAGVIAVLAVGYATVAFMNAGFGSRTDAVEQEFAELKAEVIQLTNDTETLTSHLHSISQALEEATKNPKALEAAKINAHLQKLSKDLEAIQAALGSDVEKSLSVPLLRKDLAQVNTRLNERTAAASKEIDRIYDQNKWFIGLMGAMAVSLLSLAVSNFFQPRRQD